GLPPTPNQHLVSVAPTQTTRLAPMGQGRPNNNFSNTPYRPYGLIATTSARPNYKGTTRRKLSTRGGLSIRPHAGGAGPSASSSPSVVSPTSAVGPFLDASS
ncbi:hypothetical protein SESBI_50700, partial [Sesbania bispinosa]